MSSRSLIDNEAFLAHGDAATLDKFTKRKGSGLSLFRPTSLLTKENHVMSEEHIAGLPSTRWWKLPRLQKRKTTKNSVPYIPLVESSENLAVHVDAQQPADCISPSTFFDSCTPLISTETPSAPCRTHKLRERWWWKLLRHRKIHMKFGSSVSEEDWSESENSTDDESYVKSLSYARLYDSCESDISAKTRHGLTMGQKQCDHGGQKKTSQVKEYFQTTKAGYQSKVLRVNRQQR